MIEDQPEELSEVEKLKRMLIEQYEAGRRSRDAEVEALQKWIPLQSMIVVSRQWKNPQIRVQYLTGGVAIDISSKDYAKSLAAASKIGQKFTGWRKLLNWDHPTPEQVESALLACVDSVEHEMKLATVQCPPPVEQAK